MRMREDSEGKVVIDGQTILPDAAIFSAKVVDVKTHSLALVPLVSVPDLS